jgi:hypothetical protein
MDTIKKQEAPKWVKAVNAYNIYLSQNLLGGPKVIKTAWVINLPDRFCRRAIHDPVQ